MRKNSHAIRPVAPIITKEHFETTCSQMKYIILSRYEAHVFKQKNIFKNETFKKYTKRMIFTINKDTSHEAIFLKGLTEFLNQKFELQYIAKTICKISLKPTTCPIENY